MALLRTSATRGILHHNRYLTYLRLPPVVSISYLKRCLRRACLLPWLGLSCFGPTLAVAEKNLKNTELGSAVARMGAFPNSVNNKLLVWIGVDGYSRRYRTITYLLLVLSADLMCPWRHEGQAPKADDCFGRPPTYPLCLENKKVMLLYEKIQNDPLEFPPEVNLSAGLKRLLTAMMAKGAAQRITLDQV